jgi:hypothetical protein
MSTVSIFPFRSKHLMNFSWYLVGGCIGGQRCVAPKNRVDATFDLYPVTLKPKFLSALYLLNEWRFLVDIWWKDVSGDKGVSRERKNCVDATFDLYPVTLKPKFPSALYLLNEWRFLVDIWWEDVGRVVCRVKDSCQCDLDPKLHHNSLPVCIS